MLQIAFHAEVLRKIKRIILCRLQFASELVAHRLFTQICDMRQHPCNRQSVIRLLRIISPVPVRIAHDRLPADPVECNRLRGNTRGRRNRDGAFQAVRIQQRPAQHLHSAHGSAGHAEPFADSEMIHQLFLCMNHIGDRHKREIHPVLLSGRRIDGAGSRGPRTAADHVRTHDEILLRIKRFPRADHGIPPARFFIGFGIISGHMCVAGKSMFYENGIVRIRRESPVGLIAKRDRCKKMTALKKQTLLNDKILRGNESYTVLKMFRFHPCSPFPARREQENQERDFPESAFSASRYFSRVFITISSGSIGAGGVLSQSRLSR